MLEREIESVIEEGLASPFYIYSIWSPLLELRFGFARLPDYFVLITISNALTPLCGRTYRVTAGRLLITAYDNNLALYYNDVCHSESSGKAYAGPQFAWLSGTSYNLRRTTHVTCGGNIPTDISYNHVWR